MTGCKSASKAQTPATKMPSPKPVALTPADFVAAQPTQSVAAKVPTPAAMPVPTPKPVPTTMPAMATPAPVAATQPAKASPVSPAHSLSATKAYQVGGMVGQVNGRPIYAHHVFSDIHERLADIGSRLPRGTFRQQAEQLLRVRLKQIVMDALILGEAEGRLTGQQRTGLFQFLQQERKKLIRELGRGSEALASERSRTTSGLTLDQRMEDRRREVIVQTYLREKLFPKINVSRKDIKRYYKNHEAQFNPPRRCTIHLIRTKDAYVADAIDKELEMGRDFLDIACDKKLNSRTWENKGLFGEGITGDKPFGNDALNEATLGLAEGECSKRLKVGSMFTWVYVAKISKGECKSLRESQLKIERILRQQQYSRLSDQYQQRLLENGSYNNLEDMLDKLLTIAMSLYASS